MVEVCEEEEVEEEEEGESKVAIIKLVVLDLFSRYLCRFASK